MVHVDVIFSGTVCLGSPWRLLYRLLKATARLPFRDLCLRGAFKTGRGAETPILFTCDISSMQDFLRGLLSHGLKLNPEVLAEHQKQVSRAQEQISAP